MKKVLFGSAVALGLMACIGVESNTEYKEGREPVSSAKALSSSKALSSAAISSAGLSSQGGVSSGDVSLSSSSEAISSSAIVATEADIVINEINSEGVAGSYCDYVELYNNSEADYTFKAGEWYIQDGAPADTASIPDAVIQAKSTVAFCTEKDPATTFTEIPNELAVTLVPAATKSGFGLSGSKGDKVSLYFKGSLHAEIVWGAGEIQNTGGRFPDGTGDWTRGLKATPNAKNEQP
jgi:hypothetical protein